MILLDTSFVSRVFRRSVPSAGDPAVAAYHRMIEEDVSLFLPGIVAQEVLSGLRPENEFVRMARILEGFALVLAEKSDHLRAAQVFNICARKGISTSAVDCLIAALAIRLSAPLATFDEDFSRIAHHTELMIHRI